FLFWSSFSFPFYSLPAITCNQVVRFFFLDISNSRATHASNASRFRHYITHHTPAHCTHHIPSSCFFSAYYYFSLYILYIINPTNADIFGSIRLSCVVLGPFRPDAWDKGGL